MVVSERRTACDCKLIRFGGGEGVSFKIDTGGCGRNHAPLFHSYSSRLFQARWRWRHEARLSRQYQTVAIQ